MNEEVTPTSITLHQSLASLAALSAFDLMLLSFASL